MQANERLTRAARASRVYREGALFIALSEAPEERPDHGQVGVTDDVDARQASQLVGHS
jgi:hypothetical protein